MMIVVPSGQPVCSFITVFPPCMTRRVPSFESCVLVISSQRVTAAIEANASPLKPKVSMESRSRTDAILLVAWRRKAVLASFAGIPQPSSVTLMYDLPPFLISTTTEVAPASSAFSTSSFTIETGLSITSPAAILSAMDLSKTLIIYFPHMIF